MKRTVKLNEKDLSHIVKKVIKEDSMEGFPNLEEYENTYSELVSKLSNLIDELDILANEFEDLGEEVYSQVDPTYGDEEEDYDREQMNADLEDIAQSSLSYVEIISRCTNKIAGYM
jgi:hypothetical protein